VQLSLIQQLQIFFPRKVIFIETLWPEGFIANKFDHVYLEPSFRLKIKQIKVIKDYLSLCVESTNYKHDTTHTTGCMMHALYWN
jgi:hypothetical protein